MSDKREQSLSGVWTGVFDYDSLWGEATPFNAIITEDAGAVSGEIIEPNTIANDTLPEIFASISGDRTALDVYFVKTYEQRPNAGHNVHYHGVADADLSRITGTWSIMAGIGGSGPFVMNRSDSGASSSQEAEETQKAPAEAISVNVGPLDDISEKKR